MTKLRTTLIQKNPSNHPKQLHTNNKLAMKSGKRHLTDGMELSNQDKIRTHGVNETYKYFGSFEVDTIEQMEMKETIQK